MKMGQHLGGQLRISSTSKSCFEKLKIYRAVSVYHTNSCSEYELSQGEENRTSKRQEDADEMLPCSRPSQTPIVGIWTMRWVDAM